LSRTKSQSRIDSYWRPYLVTVAGIYVASGEVKLAACRALNARYELPKTIAGGKRVGAFTDRKLLRWLETPEFQGYVQDAKRAQIESGANAPETQSAGFRRFAKEAVERYLRLLEEAQGELADCDEEAQGEIRRRIAGIEQVIVTLRKAEREEERHADDLARRAAMREIAAFAKALASCLVHLQDAKAIRKALKNAAKMADAPSAAIAVEAAMKEIGDRPSALHAPGRPVTIMELHEAAARA